MCVCVCACSSILFRSVPIHNREMVCIFSVQSFIRCLYQCSGSRLHVRRTLLFVRFVPDVVVVVIVVAVAVVVIASAVAATTTAAAALYRFGIILKWIFVVGLRVVVLLFGERVSLRRV